MKAIILAAGAGTRVRPLTGIIPKPMLPIVDKPVIDFLVELLGKHGVEQVMINVSHLGWKIQEYLKDGSRYGLNIGYSFEGYFYNDELVTEPIGSAGGMKKIQDFSGFFDETFVVLCGDAVVDLDLSSICDKHKKSGAIATIAAKHVSSEQVSNYGVIVCEDDNRVVSFQEKPSKEEAKSTLVNTGIYIFEPDVLNYVPSKSFYDIGSQLIPDLVAREEEVRAVDAEISWFDIGRTTDYLRILKLALTGGIPGFIPGGKELREGIFVGAGASVDASARLEPPVYIGGACRVGANTLVKGPSILGANSVIGDDCEVDRAVVLDYTSIQDNTSIRGVLVSPDFVIDSQGDASPVEETQLNEKVKDSRTLH